MIYEIAEISTLFWSILQESRTWHDFLGFDNEVNGGTYP